MYLEPLSEAEVFRGVDPALQTQYMVTSVPELTGNCLIADMEIFDGLPFQGVHEFHIA